MTHEPPHSTNLGSRPGRLLAIALLLTIHSASLWAGFVDFDDDTIFLNNPVLTRSDLAVVADVFATDRPDWRPVRDLSHWVDHLAHGQDPMWAHLHNLVLLGVLAWLVMLFLGTELAVLLAFAHPVVVEPVAWVSGRKDLLAGVFFFAMLLAFQRVLRGGGRRWIVATGACFALAAMSKGHVLVAPAVLACVLWWQGGEKRRAWAAIAVVTVLALAAVPLVARGNVMMAAAPVGAAIPTLTWADRAALPAWYAWNLVWPLDLNHIYLTRDGLLAPLAGVALLAVWVGAIAKRRDPLLAIPLLLLLPYLHLISQGTVYMADRYLFLALPFLAFMLAPLLARGALVVALVWAAVSVHTHTAWFDSVSLWSRMTRVYPTSAWGYERLGRALFRVQLYEEAYGAWAAATDRDPTDAQHRNNAAVALMALGRYDMAREVLRRALEVNPGDAQTKLNLLRLASPPSRAPPSDRAPE